MTVVPLHRPFNIETNIVPAIINSLEDPLQQGRVRIQTPEMSGVPPEKLPWAKAIINHSQVTSNKGGTNESPHSFKVGDLVLVYRATGSEQDWTIYGHPGTTNTGDTNQTGAMNFFWNGDLRTGNATSAKPKVIKTQYPKDGMPQWFNPGQIMSELASQPDVRQFFDHKAGQYDKPALYQSDLWKTAQHILQSAAVGSPITQVILHEDENFLAEAQKSAQALQMLHRLRLELNMSDFNQFIPKSMQGLMQTFQSLLSGGGLPGMQGLNGMVANLLSIFQQMGQNSINIGSNQNQAVSNNQFITTPTPNIPVLNSVIGV